jgi:hypothetical protein
VSRGAPKPATFGRFKTGQCCRVAYTSFSSGFQELSVHFLTLDVFSRLDPDALIGGRILADDRGPAGG